MFYSENSGQIFIAYRGTEFSHSEIINTLRRRCPSGYTVNYKESDDLIFAKIVYEDYMEDRDPNWNNDRDILTVNGYNQNEIERACNTFPNYELYDHESYQCIIKFYV